MAKRAPTAAERSHPCPHPFPFRWHRNMAEVIADETGADDSHVSFVEMARPVVEAAALGFGLSYDELIKPGRVQSVAEARFSAMLALYRAGWTFKEIAEATGRSHHTTAINGVEKALRLEHQCPEFGRVVQAASRRARAPFVCAPKRRKRG